MPVRSRLQACRQGAYAGPEGGWRRAGNAGLRSEDEVCFQEQGKPGQPYQLYARVSPMLPAQPAHPLRAGSPDRFPSPSRPRRIRSGAASWLVPGLLAAILVVLGLIFLRLRNYRPILSVVAIRVLGGLSSREARAAPDSEIGTRTEWVRIIQPAQPSLWQSTRERY